MKWTINLKRIARCAIFGAVGFGIGGLIAGAFQESIGTSGDYFSASVLMMPIWGGFGAVSLGLALGAIQTVILGVLGVVAPIVGIMMVALLVVVVSESVSIWLIYGVALFTMSLVTALPFGLLIWGRSNWKRIVGLIIVGILSFGIAQLILNFWYGDDNVVGLSRIGPNKVGFTVFGIMSGCILGVALGFLQSDKDEFKLALKKEEEKQKTRETPKREDTQYHPDAGECPFCGSTNIDEGLIYSWQRVCLDCKKEWNIAHK